MGAHSLNAAGLRVLFGAVAAVDGVDLHAATGATVALLGPSGSGKSTILRGVAGLEPLAAGRVEIDGHDVTAAPPERRGIGLMFQDYALFPHRDVGANVGFGVRMAGAGRGAVAARVAEVLDLVGLVGFERRYVASLSGGEQQRVALARALAPSPRLLLLDEPLGSLDRALREHLALELRALFRRLRTTVITVTHDQAEAFTMADEVVLLRAGRVVQRGAPLEVWRHPADAAAARFLGFTNVLPTTVRAGVATTPWGPVPADRPDGPAAVVIRPDGLTLTTEPARSSLPGTAAAAVFRGAHFLVEVVLEAGVCLEVTAGPDAVPATGATVHVALDAGLTVVVAP